MDYREPGAYLSVVTNQTGVEAGVQMLPCVIGPGARKFQKTELLTRSATTRDAFTTAGVTKITLVADYAGGPAAYAEETDYTLTQEGGISYITWVADHGPTVGASYYATIIYSAASTQYDLTTVYSREAFIALYGDDLRVYEDDSPINYLAVAGKAMFDNGASKILVQQINCTGEVPTKSEFQAGLDNLALDKRVWRIVPTHVSADIISALRQHLITCSSYEERAERRAGISVPYDGSTIVRPTQFSGANGVLSVVGNYAHATAFERMTLVYPDFATYTFSDGVRREVGGQMIQAAFAGVEAANKPSASRTRMRIAGFYELKGVKMRRSEMNALAPMGVTILTQEVIGSDLVVRHGMTTDYTSTETREISLGAVADYCAKSLRESVEMYIGKYNIDNELLTMVKGTMESRLSSIAKLGIIISGSVLTIVQDSEHQDTIAVAVRAYVPYPCNYIDIIMYL